VLLGGLGGAAQAQNAPMDSSPKPESKAGWAGPFGGRFNANFTVASEYAQSGISNTQRQPALQAGLDYRTPELNTAPPAWLYGSVWGSNVAFPGLPMGLELDFIGGGKLLVLERKMKFDLSYTRYTYPDLPASAQLGYGEVGLDIDYDFDWIGVSARVRWSDNNSGGSGHTWNKRLRLTVPLDFLKELKDDVSFTAYGTLGNYWIENPPRFGVDRNEYWYWQVGVVTSVWGVDVNLAYTATNIPPQGCSGTMDCSGRFLAAVTKTF
jgi:uncharacterized protein (TIGR02001 family)